MTIRLLTIALTAGVACVAQDFFRCAFSPDDLAKWKLPKGRCCR